MLASAYGLQYNLPQEQQSSGRVAGQDQSGMELPMDYGQGGLLDQELYVKEGLTDEYYKKVSALKSFANEVSSRYGYDVTRPNYRDRESIKYHKAYLQSLADLQKTQNELKRLASQENIALRDPNVSLRTGKDGGDYFVNTGSNDIVKRLSDTSKNIKSQDAAEDFDLVKSQLVEQLNEEIQSSQSQRERDQLTSTIRQIESIIPDTGLNEYSKAQIDYQNKTLERGLASDQATQNYRNRQLGLQERELSMKEEAKSNPFSSLTNSQATALNGRIQTLKDIANEESLKTLGFKRVDRSGGTYIERTDSRGNTESVKIDPKDPKGSLYNLNKLIDSNQEGTAVSMDLLNNMVDIDSFAKSIIDPMSPKQDNLSGFLGNFEENIKGGKFNESIANGLKSSKSIVPPGLIEGSGDKPAVIQDVKIKTDWFGDGSDIEISVSGKNGSKKKRSFRIGNPQDMADLKTILGENSDVLDIPELNSTTIAPTNSSTPLIDDSML